MSVRPKPTVKRLVLAALLVVVAVAGWRAARSWRRQALETASYPPPPPGMTLVPAGAFLMGSADPDVEPDERGLHRLWLPAYYIDVYEVTNAEFKRFRPTHTYPEGADDLPVTAVLKTDAQAYAAAVGKRLPSEAEWEKAARGTDGRRYPWGDVFDALRANIRADGTVTDTRKQPVGSHPAGVSVYGCHDMAGNVWEWVADVYRDRHWSGLGHAGVRRGILRGGAHGYSPYQARCSYRGFEDLQVTCNDVGFRCVADARPLPAGDY